VITSISFVTNMVTMTSISPITLLFTAILLSSCMYDNSEYEKRVRPLHAFSIESIEINQNSLIVDVAAEVPSSGWKMISPLIGSGANEYHITLRGEHYGGPSLPMLDTLSSKVTLRVVPGNSYTIKFWRRHEATLDTTILIPH